LNANYLSFSDKNDLTNGIDGVILRAMNTNVTSPKADARLNRIKIVSRLVKYVTLGLFVSSIGNSLIVILPTWFHAPIMERPLGHGLNFISQVIMWVWYWNLAKLFDFYEHGLIFAAKTIRCVKMLGLLCVASWLSFRIGDILTPSRMIHFPNFPTPPGFEVYLVRSNFNITLFNFTIYGIHFGEFLAGVVIVLIAWIMDEGRKIQEEQELTV
jgi:hypothetical protein